jgi:hypothetical protein
VSFWKKSGDRTIIARPRAADPPQDARGNVGEYQLLYKYLRDRYANRLVLTFAEIEDLLGFALPEEARLQQEWWGSTDATVPRAGKSSAHANSWTLASRSATVNLSAQTVVFERQVSTD